MNHKVSGNGSPCGLSGFGSKHPNLVVPGFMVDEDLMVRYDHDMDLDRIESLERRVAQLEEDRRAMAEAGVKVLEAVFQVVEYSNASFLSITSNESVAALKDLSEMIAMARAAFINICEP